jgi:hypothetical protein
MKDLRRKDLEESRPSGSAEDLLEFCLEALYRDKEHVVGDVVVYGLTYEELIGALLMVRDEIENLKVALREADYYAPNNAEKAELYDEIVTLIWGDIVQRKNRSEIRTASPGGLPSRTGRDAP